MKHNLHSAFPETPAGFHDALERTVKEIESMKIKKRHKVSVVLLAALISLLVLAGVAFAVTRGGLLSSIFHDEQPNAEAEKLLQTGTSEAKSDFVFSADEYLLDDNAFHIQLSLTYTGDEELYFGIEDATRGDARFSGSSGSSVLGMKMLKRLEKGAAQAIRGSAELAEAFAETGSFELHYTAYVLRPVTPVRQCTTEQEYNNLVYTAREGFIASPDGYACMDFDKLSSLMRENYGTPIQTLYEMTGYMEIVEQIPLTVEISVPQATAHTEVDGEKAFRFDGYTLEILRMDFGASKTLIDLRVYPDNPEDIAEHGALLYRDYAFLDENGADIFLGAPGGGGWGREEDDDGKACMVYRYDYRPSHTPPRTVTIVPKNTLGATYQKDEAVTVTLRTVK